MEREQEIRELAAHFHALGAEDPENWAASQVDEGINQYGRFVFLRQAWTNVVPDGDTAWIETMIADADREPGAPGTGAGPALRRLLGAGASPQDLTDLVRVMQWQTLAGLIYQLDDPGTVQYPTDNLPTVNWILFEVDEDDDPLQPIDGLHESLLGTDPTGREMRPRASEEP